MNAAKIVLKNTQHKNILYFTDYFVGHGLGFFSSDFSPSHHCHDNE